MTAWYSYPEWNNYRQYYGSTIINGDDIATPYNTPITALVSGTVTKQYYDASGGVLMIQPDDPNALQGAQYYYYAHLDTTPVSAGQHVIAGQEIGRSGGQLSGGIHPASPQWSTGPHIMVGLSHSPSIPVSSPQLTPELNPHWLIERAKGSPINLISGSSVPGAYPAATTCTCDPGYTLVKGGLGQSVCRNQSFPYDTRPCREVGANDPFTSISQFFQSISQFTEWLSNPLRIVKLVVGVMLVGIALILIASPQAQIVQKIRRAIR